MTETEERLFRMMEQQQALTAALIARLGGVLQGDVPGMVIEAAPEVHRIEAQASVPADDGLPRKKIADVIAEYRDYLQGRVKPTSIANVISKLLKSQFTKEFTGEKYIDELTWIAVQRYIDEKKVHTTYFKDYIGELMRLIRWLRDRRICRVPPENEKPFSFRRVNKNHGKEMEDEDYCKLEKYCVDNCRSDFGAAGVVIALHTGMRIGEICGLKAGDFDGEKKTLSVNRTLTRVYDSIDKATKLVYTTPKSKTSMRTIPLDETAYSIISYLAEGMDAETSIIRFPNTNSKVEVRELRSKYERILKKLGIKKYTFHSLRHTFISRRIRDGANPKAVCAYAGHSGLEMTIGIYTHINANDLQAVVK